MATVFSYTLEINGTEYSRFGNPCIRQSADGYGTSGVCTSSFTFDIPAEDYVYGSIPSAAPVKLYFGERSVISPTFYISTRQKSGGIVTFKCYDKMMHTDRTIEIDGQADGSFIDDVIDGETLVSIIARQCGFVTWQWGRGNQIETAQPPQISIQKDYVIGKSCRALLEAVSTAWCGYFKVSISDTLVFIPFECKFDESVSHSHAAISEGGTKGPIYSVIMSGGGETYTAGGESDVFYTLKLASDFASQQLAEQILERVKGYEYQAWQCPKCFLQNGSGNMEIDTEITFADGSVRIANALEKIPTPAGIICTCSRNDVVEDEFNYTGALSREIEKRIEDGEVLGNNMILTRYQGAVFLYNEGNSSAARNAENTAVEKYGFTVNSGGLIESDGVMSSKKEAESVKIDTDANTVTVTFSDGHTYTYSANVEQSGNTFTLTGEEAEWT